MAETSRPRAIRLHASDPVAIALVDLVAGEDVLGARARRPILCGHKLALRSIARGETVLRYGQPIGVATRAIEAGDLVHVENLELGALEGGDHADLGARIGRSIVEPTPITGRTFRGYRRPDGRVGTRNYIAIVSSVNCSAFVAKRAAALANARIAERGITGVDGVFAVTHPRGCGIAMGSEAHERMNRVLAGYLEHPNVAARVLVGLGCEKSPPGAITAPRGLVQVELAGAPDTEPVPLAVTIQEEGGTEASIARLVAAVQRLVPRVAEMQREEVPARHLIVGTQCGGSDGLSGITANPAIGAASDRIVAAGGRSVFAETSETFGAQTIIVSRARTEAVARRYLALLDAYGEYLAQHGVDFRANTALGNHAGGITTIAEKALGSVMKSGTAPLAAVYDYAEAIDVDGLGFMNTPAFDPASCTALNAGGANLGLFSTGRGSCYGSKPVPWIKVASSTSLFERMSRDMDVNAGRIADGEVSVDEAGAELFERVLAVASGERTWSERHGYGDDEFVLWDTGPMT